MRFRRYALERIATLEADTVVESVLIFGALVAVRFHLGTIVGVAVSAKWRTGA